MFDISQNCDNFTLANDSKNENELFNRNNKY